MNNKGVLAMATLLLGLGVTACETPPAPQVRLKAVPQPGSAEYYPYWIDQRIQQHGEEARDRLRPHFQRAGVPYPPAAAVLVGIKQEKNLELYATPRAGESPRFVRSWPVLGASGGLGPKLREGDRQVPEGIYRVESLNPLSSFHLSLRLNYPNDFDRHKGRLDGRKRLGNDIMIHGDTLSSGCLAMGDPAAEELFVLAHDTGIKNLQVILAPVDFRVARSWTPPSRLPPWSGELYAGIRAELDRLPAVGMGRASLEPGLTRVARGGPTPPDRER